MKDYFDTNIHNPKLESVKIDNLIKDDMTLIVGDFWGIQSFIFDGLTTKYAAKVLRSKSAFIQLFTEVLAKYICDRLGIDKKYILTINAGKFEILAPFKDVNLTYIQKEIDKYFIENFYGLSGAIVCDISVSKKEWQDNYKDFREKVAKEIEIAKFKKFDLVSQNPVLEYDEGVDNQTLCKICNIRKIDKENCKICNIFVDLGKQLTKQEQITISSNELGIVFDDFNAKIKIDKKIKSYIPKKEYGEPLTFEDIANSSCKELETGIKALGIIKADVDGMGDFIKNSDVTKNFSNFDEFSQGLDSFFSLYVPQLLREKYRDIYTVFAGGDDLFLMGAWDEVMEFARKIRKDFRKYVKNELSISFGIAIAKPTTPVSFLANHTEELLETSKEVDGKDALTIWNESVKWDIYLDVFNELNEVFKNYKDLETTTLYRFVEFCNMSKRVKKSDIKATIWKSKLNYLFSRNLDVDKDKDLMEALDKMIDEQPEATKIFLYEFIYKRRLT